MKDSYRNPFDGINASQLDDQTILEYWCSPFNYKLFDNIQESDMYSNASNTVIIGGRSSGKTMLLRYCSFSVQFKKAIAEITSKNELLDYFINKGGICFYKRIDGSALNDFNKKNISEEKKLAVFTHYFELNLCYEYVDALNKIVQYSGTNIDKKIFTELSTHFLVRISSFDECLAHIDTEIKRVDDYRSKLPFYENLELNTPKIFASTTLSYKIPEIISNAIPQFKKINFILLLDEYENFASSQQRMVNTLLKFTKPNIEFRLSMRPEGFNTLHTVSDDDVIQEGREYRVISFDNVILKNQDYDKFIIDVCKKRLEAIKIFRDNRNTDIVSFLTLRENLEDEAIALTEKHPGKHFKFNKFKSIPQKELALLKHPENPLLEMLNLLWLSRGIAINDISKAMQDYLAGKVNENSIKYKRDYVNKYKLSLTILLASVYKKQKMYYSFRTFSFLSFGMIGHFLELCDEAFKYAAFEDKDMLLSKGKISKEAQNKAAFEVSYYQLRKTSTTPVYGNLIYQFINNVGTAFQSYHLDSKIKYPETNQFSVDYLLIKEQKYKEAFRHAIRWSAIQRKKSKQRPSPSKNIADIYTINRIFAPVFGITYRTRGGYSIEMTPDDVISFMTEKINPTIFLNSKAQKKKRNAIDKEKKGSDDQQGSLF